MNRRELLLRTVAVAGGGYVLWDLGVLSAPDGVEEVVGHDGSGPAPKEPQSKPDGSDGTTSTATKPVQDVPRMVHDGVNAFRQDNDRNVLRWSPALARMATEWATEMSEGDELSHRSGSLVDTAESFGAGCDQAGENVAQSWMNERIELPNGDVVEYSTPAELAAGLVRQWANSPGHRANMLEVRYTQLGVGVDIDTNGQVWAVQNFC
jgi:uncharacterized protein YkwD